MHNILIYVLLIIVLRRGGVQDRLKSLDFTFTLASIGAGEPYEFIRISRGDSVSNSTDMTKSVFVLVNLVIWSYGILTHLQKRNVYRFCVHP